MRMTLAVLLLLVNSAVMADQVKIEGGVFTPLYGSTKRPVKVDSFSMDVAPVTNADFLKFVTSQPAWGKSAVKPIFAEANYLHHWASPTELGPGASPDGPVVNVSWFAAKAYCESRGMRMPTVNEWEYVASRPIPGADVRKVIFDWYSVPTPEILPSVQSGYKNANGVFNLHGLIWEWTLDFNSAMVTGESGRMDHWINHCFVVLDQPVPQTNRITQPFCVLDFAAA